MQTISLGADQQEASIFSNTDVEVAHKLLKNKIASVYRWDLINPNYLATVGIWDPITGDRIAKFLNEYMKIAKEWKKSYADKKDYPKWREALLPRVGYSEAVLERHLRYFRELGDAIPKSIREPWTYTTGFQDSIVGQVAKAGKGILSGIFPYVLGAIAVYAVATGVGKGVASRA